MEKELTLYKEKYQPFYNNLNNYLKSFIIPDVIAFYIYSSFEYKIINKYPLENYLNSALNIFNVNLNINKLIPKIKNILLIKYHLKIVKTNPLIIKKEH